MSTEKKFYFARKSTGLLKQISLWEAIMFGSGPMGLFGISYVYLVYGSLFPGSNLVISALISIGIFLCFAVTYTMLSISMPRSGGEYIFLSRTLGPFAGFVGSFWFYFLTATWVGTGPAWMVHDGLNPMLWALAKLTGNEALITTSDMLNTNESIIVISLIILGIMTGISMLGTRAWMKAFYVLYFTGVVSFIVYIVVALTGGGANFVSNFDAYSGTTVATMIETANAEGFTTSGFSWSSTMLGVIFTALSYTGFTLMMYVGGEIKEAQKNILVSTFGALLIFAGGAIVTYAVSYLGFGIEVIRSLTYLWATGNPAYPFPYGPFPHLLALFLTNNPVIVFIVGLSFLATVLIAMLGNMIACQRCLFGWAFDRILPDRVSAVDMRRGVPYNAALVTIVVAIVSMFLYVYTPVFQFFVYLTVSWMIVYIFVGFAGIAFPFRRKDIFDVAPAWTRRKIGNIPMVSIFGVITVILAFILGIISMLPAYTGAPINPLYISLIPIVFIMAIVIYGISYAANKSRGIELSLIFKELPPE